MSFFLNVFNNKFEVSCTLFVVLVLYINHSTEASSANDRVSEMCCVSKHPKRLMAPKIIKLFTHILNMQHFLSAATCICLIYIKNVIGCGTRVPKYYVVMAHWWPEGCSPCILNLCIKFMRVVIFTPRRKKPTISSVWQSDKWKSKWICKLNFEVL